MKRSAVHRKELTMVAFGFAETTYQVVERFDERKRNDLLTSSHFPGNG